MSCTRLETSFGSVCASFFRLCAVTNAYSAQMQHTPRSYITIYSDVTESGCAVILHISVRRVQQADQDWDRAGVHKLLPVFI